MLAQRMAIAKDVVQVLPDGYGATLMHQHKRSLFACAARYTFQGELLPRPMPELCILDADVSWVPKGVVYGPVRLPVYESFPDFAVVQIREVFIDDSGELDARGVSGLIGRARNLQEAEVRRKGT